jgi:hypothetical protein
MSEIDFLGLIADDRQMVSYRPSWNSFTGAVNSTILLQQIIYRWTKSGRRPFYKFSSPCSHLAYRPGDSWREEIGMTRSEFETARKNIAIRTKGQLNRSQLVSYWVTSDRKTWYALNEQVLLKCLQSVYPSPPAGGVGIQGELLPDESSPDLMQDSSISVMQDSSITLMQDSSIVADAGFQHPTMQDSSITLMQDSSTSYNKDNIDNTQRQPETNNKNNSKEAGIAVVDVSTQISNQILDWMGFNGGLNPADNDPSIDLLLSWGMWVHVEGKELVGRGKNAVGIARAGWRRGDVPGGGWIGLARLWLTLNDSGRWDLIDAAENRLEYVTRDLEDLKISTFDLGLVNRLWRATDGSLVPDLLWPMDEIKAIS